MTFISTFLQKVNAMFHKPAVETAFNTVAQVVTIAEPIVAEIAAAVPNRSVQEIVAAYEKYGVPMAQTIASDPSSTANALLNLATALVQKNLGNNQPALNIIQTAIQIAVTAARA